MSETEVWLYFSKDLGCLENSKYNELIERYDEVSRMLAGMIENADKFCSSCIIECSMLISNAPYSLLLTPYFIIGPIDEVVDD